MNVLVTGGAGFMGSHVAQCLVDMGRNVVVLDDLSGGRESNVPHSAHLVRGSVCDVRLVDALFSEYGFTHVYHLAAYAAEGLSHFIKRFNYTNNLIGSVNLINACVNHGADCFVFTSSIAVYGSGQVPMREATVPEPEDPYGISKYAVELDLRESQRMFGLDSVVFRPHNVFGEHQNIGDRYRNVVGIFMNQIMQNRPMTVFGDGLQTRAFTYIADIAPIIARAPEVVGARNRTFNIGADTPVRVLDLAREVAHGMGVEPDVVHLPARDEVKHAFADHSLVRSVFGGTSSTPLRVGLERMAAWARSVGAKASKSFGKVEVPKNMPPSWRAVTSAEVVRAAT